MCDPVKFFRAIAEIAKQAGQLSLYQRSANWVGPREDTPFTAEQLEEFEVDPMAARRQRWRIWRTIEGVITFSNPEILRRAEDDGSFGRRGRSDWRRRGGPDC